MNSKMGTMGWIEMGGMGPYAATLRGADQPDNMRG